MYNLGEQFKFNYDKSKVNDKSVIRGKKYRITIITDRLIRFEYNDSGLFEDRPTELIWYRNFETPEFEIKQDEKYLEVTSKYFKIFYINDKKFQGGRINPTANLKVELLNSDRYWYYGHPEIRNYGAPYGALSDRKGRVKFKKALFSSDGFVSIDDANSRIISESGDLINRDNKGVDVYLFMYLNDYALCLQDYFKLTGYPALLPRYALGNWWSRNEDYDDTSLKVLIDKFENKKVPLSVLVLNKDWHIRQHEKKKDLNTGFTFNKDYFKAPYEMIEHLHSKGIRVGLNIDPTEGIYPIDEYYNKARQYLSVNDAGVIPFNALDPKFIDVYLKLLIHPLDSLGVDFFWLDVDKSKERDLWILNHYHFYDMMRNYKRRPMVLSKNAGIAPHRYPVLYSGKTVVSWETLKLIPFHNSSAANIGVSWWSHDIGGYYKGIEDNELYTRFVQLGVFSPILKFGAEKGKYYKREPWRWGIKTHEIVKSYLVLRHRLIPYLYTEAYKYHTLGLPVLQPIYYKFPEMYDDIKYCNEYYLGTELFIAPIVTKKDYVMNRVIHKFFIPDGVWYDFVTGKKFPGGRAYVSFFKDQDYPVFAKAGSIIALGDNENINDTTPPKNIEIHIFPGRSNVYKLYEDDGVSDLHRKGFYLLTSIDYNYLPNNYTVIIRALEGKSGIAPATRNYKIRFRNTKRADEVITYFNDYPIDHTAYNDGPDFIVEVNDVSTIGQLTFNCKGKDIEIDATRLINEDIEEIISDLPIETQMKEKIDKVIFSELPVKKKRIAVRRLKGKGLERKFIKLFLKLLEYVGQV